MQLAQHDAFTGNKPSAGLWHMVHSLCLCVHVDYDDIAKRKLQKVAATHPFHRASESTLPSTKTPGCYSHLTLTQPSIQLLEIRLHAPAQTEMSATE